MTPKIPPADSGPSTEKAVGWREYLRLRYISLLAFVGVLAGSVAGYGHYTDPGPLSEPKDVLIPHGSTLEVASALQKAGVLAPGLVSRDFFRLAFFLTSRDGQIHAAEFALPARVSVGHLLEILRHGHPVQHYLTIPEGWTARRIGQTLEQLSGLSGAVPDLKEGSVFPQTYAYTLNMSRGQLSQHMQALMKTSLRNVWEKRDQKALDGIIQTPEELLILASLIERETALPAERAQVARVFLNRLQKGMKLQTDPTVIYALSDGWGSLNPPLAHEDLQTISPYNTYLNSGLPPGPICSPSLSSLQAAAHPVQGEALYFVANGRGGHNFSANLAKHNENIRAYHQALEQQASP